MLLIWFNFLQTDPNAQMGNTSCLGHWRWNCHSSRGDGHHVVWPVFRVPLRHGQNQDWVQRVLRQLGLLHHGLRPPLDPPHVPPPRPPDAAVWSKISQTGLPSQQNRHDHARLHPPLPWIPCSPRHLRVDEDVQHGVWSQGRSDEQRDAFHVIGDTDDAGLSCVCANPSTSNHIHSLQSRIQRWVQVNYCKR